MASKENKKRRMRRAKKSPKQSNRIPDVYLDPDDCPGGPDAYFDSMPGLIDSLLEAGMIVEDHDHNEPGSKRVRPAEPLKALFEQVSRGEIRVEDIADILMAMQSE